MISPHSEKALAFMEEEQRSLLFSEFAYRNGGLKKKENSSKSDGALFLPSIHPGKKRNAQPNLPMIHSQSWNSRVISPYFQKNKTLECNCGEIISPYFKKAVKEEEERGSVVPSESETRGMSPYFQKKRAASDSNSRWSMSHCFQKAQKQQRMNLDEHCNISDEIDDNEKKKKKKRKKKANDTFESSKEGEKKINVQNVGMDDQAMGAELPISNSNFSSQRKVSPFFQKSVKDEQEMNLEAQAKRKTTVISPYFETKKSLVSDSFSNSVSGSGSQCILSPYFPKGVKPEERSSLEHCNSPDKIEGRKIKKQKRKGHDNVESCKKRKKKINIQNFRVEGQKMNLQQPISCSNSNSQRKVSPYFEKAVKEKDGILEEDTKKGREYEESFGDEGKKTNAQNITMEDDKIKLPKKKTRRPPIRVVSPYFPINEEDAQTPVRPMKFNKLNVAYKRKSPDNNWKPPRSRFHLLQEDHYHDPWRVMVICMLLNCTTGLQASRVISNLFTLCPDAKTAIEVPTKMIENVIQSLGLQRKRAVMIQRFSQEYLDESWTHVTQLHGIGKYAADAYAIFCSGDWGLVVPKDHMLVKYWKELFSYHSQQIAQTIEKYKKEKNES